MLGSLYNNDKIKSGDTGDSDIPGQTKGQGSGANITIGKSFFDKGPTGPSLVASGSSARFLTLKGGQVWVILHELSHATGKMTHTWLEKYYYDEYHPGVEGSTQSDFDIKIIDTCFKGTKELLAPPIKVFPRKP